MNAWLGFAEEEEAPLSAALVCGPTEPVGENPLLV